jgi:hypothetical protein
LKDGKKVFQMNLKPSKKSKLGDSDIMLDAGKGMYFDHVVLGNYFKHYKLPEFKINSLRAGMVIMKLLMNDGYIHLWFILKVTERRLIE